MVKGFGAYGPAWMLIGIMLLMFVAFCVVVYKAICRVVDLMFSTDLDPISQQPKGLLIPFMREHLSVFQRTEALTEVMSSTVKTMADNNLRDTAHAERLEKLMALIEARLKALDETNNQKVHKALCQLSEMLQDYMYNVPGNTELIEKHRRRIKAILDTTTV